MTTVRPESTLLGLSKSLETSRFSGKQSPAYLQLTAANYACMWLLPKIWAWQKCYDDLTIIAGGISRKNHHVVGIPGETSICEGKPTCTSVHRQTFKQLQATSSLLEKTTTASQEMKIISGNLEPLEPVPWSDVRDRSLLTMNLAKLASSFRLLFVKYII